MKKNALLVLTTMGLLFSGYLSGVKFFTETCAFKESCPYFLGYPACYYGFAMFLTMTILAVLLSSSRLPERKGLSYITMVASLGILFAGYFTFRELPKLFAEGLTAYVLGLPTCALGLIFYIIIDWIAFKKLKEIVPDSVS